MKSGGHSRFPDRGASVGFTLPPDGQGKTALKKLRFFARRRAFTKR
jgi:hypothetical protein